jgi:hypothetical protein
MIRRIILSALLLLALPAWAQLTSAQLATLKTAILADPALSSQPLTSAGAQTIADAFNAQASPAFTVWKTSVTVRETGQVFDGTEWAGMTSANHTRLQTVAQYLASYNAGVAGIRAMFNDIWSGAGGTNTRAALLVLWKRTATRAEKLFATGTGSDAAPATLVFEGRLSSDTVQAARELP